MFLLFLKTLVNIFAKLISIIILRTRYVRESLLVLKRHLFVFYTTPNTQDYEYISLNVYVRIVATKSPKDDLNEAFLFP